MPPVGSPFRLVPLNFHMSKKLLTYGKELRLKIFRLAMELPPRHRFAPPQCTVEPSLYTLLSQNYDEKVRSEIEEAYEQAIRSSKYCLVNWSLLYTFKNGLSVLESELGALNRRSAEMWTRNITHLYIGYRWVEHDFLLLFTGRAPNLIIVGFKEWNVDLRVCINCWRGWK